MVLGNEEVVEALRERDVSGQRCGSVRAAVVRPG